MVTQNLTINCGVGNTVLGVCFANLFIDATDGDVNVWLPSIESSLEWMQKTGKYYEDLFIFKIVNPNAKTVKIYPKATDRICTLNLGEAFDASGYSTVLGFLKIITGTQWYYGVQTKI